MNNQKSKEDVIMSANVETMFYVRETPWHGLGTKVMMLWSSIFVTLVAKKYRFMQFELDRVFDTH